MGGGFQEGHFGGGGGLGRGVRAPKSKHWLITSTPYLPLPSL